MSVNGLEDFETTICAVEACGESLRPAGQQLAFGAHKQRVASQTQIRKYPDAPASHVRASRLLRGDNDFGAGNARRRHGALLSGSLVY